MRTPCLSSLVLALLGQAVPVAVASPALPAPRIAYQGRLLENTLPVTGNRDFLFSILDGTGAEQWSSGTVTLPVNNGLYAVVLGSAATAAIPRAVLALPVLKLRVAVGGTVLAPDTDLVPSLQARSAFEVTGPFAGDVGGTQTATVLQQLQGYPLDLTSQAPATGQVLAFDGSGWTAATVSGSQGPVGPAGPAGPTGPTGPQGNQGVQGLPGAAGPTGPAGATGAPGPTGPPVTFEGTWSNSTVYVTGDATSFNGSSWIALTTNINVTPGNDGMVWALLAQAGATGAAGQTGAAGAQGIQGIQGIQGPQGLPGAAGSPGATGATGATGAPGTFTSVKGAWSSVTSYATGDVVNYNGSNYTAQTGNSNVVPGTNAAVWAPLALAVPAAVLVSAAPAVDVTGSTSHVVVTFPAATVNLPAPASCPNRAVTILAALDQGSDNHYVGLTLQTKDGSPKLRFALTNFTTETANYTFTIGDWVPHALVCVSDGVDWYVQ